MTDVQVTLTVTRILDAPREQVWEAWTNPAELAQWWWPARFHTTYEVDLRVGGRYRFCTADLPDMGVLAISGTYLAIERPAHLTGGKPSTPMPVLPRCGPFALPAPTFRSA